MYTRNINTFKILWKIISKGEDKASEDDDGDYDDDGDEDDSASSPSDDEMSTLCTYPFVTHDKMHFTCNWVDLGCV